MRSTVLSKIPGGMESAMDHNLWNDSTPQGKAIRWLTEEDAPTSSSLPTEVGARLMAMRSTVMSKIPGGMESAMDHNLWNDSTPQGKAIRWLTEEDGLEVDP